MEHRDDRAHRALIAGTGLLLAYAAARVLQPMVSVLAASAIVTVVIHPLYARLLAKRPDRPNAVSSVVTAAVCFIILAPLMVGGWYLMRESVRAYPILREQAQEFLGPPESVPAWVPHGARDYLQSLNLKDLLSENIHEIGAWTGNVVRSTARNAASLALNILIFVLCVFLFLRDGRETFGRLLAALPLEPRSKARIVERTHDMIIATVQGVFLVAVFQGLLSIAGFALFRVEFPVLLGALCMLFSPLPFIGPTLVWIPVVVRIALTGQLGRAAAVALWFALIVGTSDNILRPLFIGSRSRLPAAIVVVGVFGGLQAFGVIGLFLGPVIAAIAVAVVDVLFLTPDHERA